MASHVRRVAAASGRPVKVLMDLAGPKIRTGPIAAGPGVLKIKPGRDEFGQVTTPALVGLRAVGATLPIHGALAIIEVEPDWLAQLHTGDTVEFVDARAATRRMKVIDERPGGARLECRQTAYLTPETWLRLRDRDVRRPDASACSATTRCA